MPRPFTTVLTKRQKAVLDWIKQFMKKNRMPPTLREIGDAFGFKSSSIFDYLKALERKGYLRRTGRGARTLALTHDDSATAASAPPRAAIIGRVAAGKPIFATEDDLGSVALEDEDLGRGEIYALNVKGDSMIEEGIHDGDVVLIRKQETANDGDIIVGLMDDEATLKRMRHDGNRIKLEPANKEMKPIYVEGDQLRVQGKLIGVRRRYK